MRFLITVLLAALLSSCSQFGAEELTADSPALAGLDQTVVLEVLENPVARQRVAEEPEATRTSMAQGIVRNFIVCRAAHQAYRTWIGSGVTPDAPVLPEPTNPVEPSARNWISTHRALVDAIASGEPDRLRLWITQPGSCGTWIPAIPDRPDGPTINEAIESGA